jgi:hypothetical protein
MSAAELGTPLVKARATHPVLGAQLRNWHTAFYLLQHAMICASLNRPFFIVNPLRYLAEKILLSKNTSVRRDYHGIPEPIRLNLMIGVFLALSHTWKACVVGLWVSGV